MTPRMTCPGLETQVGVQNYGVNQRSSIRAFAGVPQWPELSQLRRGQPRLISREIFFLLVLHLVESDCLRRSSTQ